MSTASTAKEFYTDAVREGGAERNPEAAVEEKLVNRVLRINTRREKKPKSLSRRKKSEKRTAIPRMNFGIPIGAKYSDYNELRSMWIMYISDIIGSKMHDIDTVGAKFAKAELCGCVMRVHESSCSSVVGLEGVCLRETQNTFMVMTKTSKVRKIGKKGSVFQIDCGPGRSVRVHGDRFLYRTSMRSTKKFKAGVSGRFA
eukprot:Clim_evm1s46 gene=Clim_evmTU1s46